MCAKNITGSATCAYPAATDYAALQKTDRQKRKVKKEKKRKELPLCQYCVVQFWGVASSRQVQVEGRGVKRRESAPSRHRVKLRAQS